MANDRVSIRPAHEAIVKAIDELRALEQVYANDEQAKEQERERTRVLNALEEVRSNLEILCAPPEDDDDTGMYAFRGRARGG